MIPVSDFSPQGSMGAPGFSLHRPYSISQMLLYLLTSQVINVSKDKDSFETVSSPKIGLSSQAGDQAPEKNN